MTSQLQHRGPDGEGYWFDAGSGIALGHRRLAIIDLSSEGRQPMVSSNGRYVIVFNGEVYNFEEIRTELEAAGVSPAWRGHSDTEVLLAAIEARGVEQALRCCVGMFAFALFDRSHRKLYLGRDRMGEKPLYYGLMGNTLLFGSELKALRAHPQWQGNIDRNNLASFLRYNYVGCPNTIYNGVRKLPAGTLLEVSAADRLCNMDELKPTPYWSLQEVVSTGLSSPFAGNDREALEQLEVLLRRAVRLQMLSSDVPVGAFLSGGIDSSTVVALMQQESSGPVRTFTIGFEEKVFDEGRYAKAVAAHLGTEHTELYVTPAQARAVIPHLPTIYDEPFSDSSQIPTYLVAQLARRDVTVSLSGDAGDELFGGYTRYTAGLRAWRAVSPLPSSIRRLMARAITSLPVRTWDGALQGLQPLLPHRYWQSGPGDKLHKFAELLSAGDGKALYRGLVSHWKDPSGIVLDSVEPGPFQDDQLPPLSRLAEWMMCMDSVTYLPDDILVKVDRAAMSVSLETRMPLLDHRVVAFAWTLPLDMRIRQGTGKWLLRRLLNQYVPESLTRRPKAGFGLPLAEWLRNELRDWAESLLDPSRMRQEGYLRPEPIRQKWAEHLSGRRNWQYWLWDVLMFQAWLQAQRQSSSASVSATVESSGRDQMQP